MLCRVLLAAVAISYLVCVLFLSGIQKEDLDVSLLKKMQHYNLDFDKNNEELRNECLNNTKNKDTGADIDYNATETDLEFTITTNIPTPITPNTILDPRDLKYILNYFKHKKETKNPTSTESYPYSENIDNVKSLFDKLMANSVDHLKKVYRYSIRNHDDKKTSLDEMNNYLQSYIEKFDKRTLTDRSNATENKTSIELHCRKEGNSTKETINNGVLFTNFTNFEQIGKAVAEYLSKQQIVTTTTSPKPEIKTTSPLQINAHDIEEKFAFSIAAINKLNENIANLQKNINGVIFFNTNSSNQAKDNKSSVEQNTGNKDVLESEIKKNLTKAFPDNENGVPTQYTPDVSKAIGINNNYDIRENADPNALYDKFQINRITMNSNSKLEFAPKVNISLYKQRFESLKLSNPKNNQIQYNPNVQNGFAPTYSYDNQKPSNHLTEPMNLAAQSTKNNQFEFTEHNITEITNYSHEKQITPDTLDAVNNQKNDYNKLMLTYFTNPQNTRDIMDYAYYLQRQSENRIKQFQYNSDGLENSRLQEEHSDINSYDTDKFEPHDTDDRVTQSNDDVFRNSQKQYTLQSGKEGMRDNYDNQRRQSTLNTDLPQLQNGKNPQHSGHGNKNEFSSYISKPQSLDNNPILNKSNDTKNGHINSLSFDMINKIAESVKQIVLKDLKKEINLSALSTTTIPLTTTKAPTTTTTVESSTFSSSSRTTLTPKPTTITIAGSTTSVKTTKTTFKATPTPAPNTKLTIAATTDLTNKSQTIDINKVQMATQAIEKFMELFDKMKSIQEKPAISNGKGSSLQVASKPVYHVPIVITPISSFGIRVPAKQMPLVVHDYMQPTQHDSPFPPTIMTSLDTTKPITQSRKPLSFKPHHFPNVVMIQTNTREIQPLGIPMMKPEAINFNIVVTTQRPKWNNHEKNQVNVMYKSNISPNKQSDIRNLKNSLNAYSNDNINNNGPVDNNIKKKLSKNEVLLNNISNAIQDRIRLDILKQFDAYNKQENSNKNKKAIDEINSRHNIISKINFENYINDNYLKAILKQMAETNENLLNMPFINKMKINSIDNVNKDYRINQNKPYSQIQNENHQMGQIYKQLQTKDNIEDVGRNANIGIIRPDNIQDSNTQIIPKENTLDRVNRINQFNIASEPFNPTRNDRLYNPRGPEINAINNKENIINDLNPPQPYRNDESNRFSLILNNKARFIDNARPNLDDRIQNFKIINQYNKAPFKYSDNIPPTVESKLTHNKVLKQGRDYLNPLFNSRDLNNDYSSSMDKNKSQFGNLEKFYSSPSDEDFNREFKSREKAPLRPYYNTGISNKQRENEYFRFQNKKLTNDQPHKDYISSISENGNTHRTKEHRIPDFKNYKNFRGHHGYRTGGETSDTDTKFGRPREENSDSEFKYPSNVKGFHEKLENSDNWPDSPSDCRPGQHCVSAVKILSRHQVPLDRKKTNKYDDSHFKNFLKTQQKVNNILEVILAAKADEFRSVETVM